MTEARSVAALIPAYNCSRQVAGVVRGASAWLADVYVVDDGSADGTVEAALRAGAKVIRRHKNGGKGTALRTGLAEILRHPFAGVLFMDADGQHSPSDVPALLGAFRSGAGDLVIGARLAAPETIPPARYWANTIGARILSRMVGAEVLDSQSGFRVVAASLLRTMRLESAGYAIETEILIKACRAGARLAHVRVETIYSDDNDSHYRPVRDTFRISMQAIKFKVFE